MSKRTIEKLETIAEGLDTLLHKVVFTGGTVLELYATDQAAPENRYAIEIECVVATPTLAEFYNWTGEMKKRGFIPRCEKQSPILKWTFQGIPVSILPLKPEMVGIQNRWFEEGVFHAQVEHFPLGGLFRILSPSYFLATKLESFFQNRNDDIRLSEDFEDIIYLLDNRKEIVQDVRNAFYEVRAYIQSQFEKLLKNPELEEGITYSIPFDAGQGGLTKILHIMNELAGEERSLAVR